MNKNIINNLNDIFKAYSEIKLVYLFGSQARGDTGPLSDYDFAVYFDGVDKLKIFDLRLDLFCKISRLLKTEELVGDSRLLKT